jgi:hypothetical protein
MGFHARVPDALSIKPADASARTASRSQHARRASAMPFTLTLAMQTLFALLPVAVAAPPQSVNATLGNGVYKSSATPAGLPWNTYNYCNAPHVNAAHYAPSPDASTAHATLEHLTVIMRHHKVGLPAALPWGLMYRRSAHRTTFTRTRTR